MHVVCAAENTHVHVLAGYMAINNPSNKDLGQ